MPVKSEPVPVESEQPQDKEKEAEPEEAAQEEVAKAQPKRRAKKAVIEAPEEPLPAEPEVHEEPKPKARAKRAPKAKAESKPKAEPKPKKEPKPKATKQDCTVCNTTVSSEALLTSHECSKSALAAKKKKVTLEEQAPPPPPLVRQPMNPREMANWVQEHPDEAFPYEAELPEAQNYGAPPTFVGDFASGVGELTIPERRLSYREALEQKYREYQHQKRASMVGPLRRAYGQ